MAVVGKLHHTTITPPRLAQSPLPSVKHRTIFPSIRRRNRTSDLPSLGALCLLSYTNYLDLFCLFVKSNF